MTTGYESIVFLLAWYSIATTLFTAILSLVFLNDCITFFGTIGKGIVSLFQKLVTGADFFGQLSNEISNSIISGIVYWLIAAIVMGILFIITGFLIIGISYQVGKIYRKYCWDIISIMVTIMSTAIAIYFGEWIKSIIPINLIALLLLVQVVYIGIRCYVKEWRKNGDTIREKWAGKTARLFFLRYGIKCNINFWITDRNWNPVFRLAKIFHCLVRSERWKDGSL